LSGWLSEVSIFLVALVLMLGLALVLQLLSFLFRRFGQGSANPVVGKELTGHRRARVHAHSHWLK
jgi:hypothetical protein